MVKGQTIFVAIISCIICLSSILYKKWEIKKGMSDLNIKWVVCSRFFIAYILCVFAVTLFPILDITVDEPSFAINIIPFNTINDLISSFANSSINTSVALSLFLYNIFGNIILFIPYGVFIGILLRKCQDWKGAILAILAFSLLIEFLQFVETSLQIVSARAIDIDDVLLNLVGGAIGFAIYKSFFAKKKLD